MTRLRRTTLIVAVTGLFAASFMSNTAWAVGVYTVTDLGTLGGSSSYAYGINARGQVVGCSDTTGDATGHAFLYSSSAMTTTSRLSPI